MAKISRFFTKDCRLQQCDDLQKLNCGLSARRLHSYQNFRCELITSESDRSNLAIHSKHQSYITAVSLPWTFASRNSRVYCKAATSGDFKDDTSKTSQYERIIETLTTLFPVWVILGTIIGIYKPAAVCFCIATADINNYQLVESWSLAGYLVRNRPIYCWFGFPHAFNGIDTLISNSMEIMEFRRKEPKKDQNATN